MTYLEYTNKVLQAINEVPLTSAQFGAARGLQQFAKDSVLRAYLDICNEFKWPWLLGLDALTIPGDLEVTGERSVPVDSEWLTIPVDNPYKDSVDWSTIYYRDADGNKYPLVYLEWEQFEDNQEHYTNTSQSPRYAVQSADGQKIGVIPFKDTLDGKLYYRLWSRPTIYSLQDDVINLPDIHYPTLVDGALHHLWSFRGNVDQAQIAWNRFAQGIKTMKIKYRNQTKRAMWA